MKIKKKDWDSKFFNMNIGEIELLDEFHNDIRSEIFDLIYVNAIKDFQISIIDCKKSYSETQLYLIKKIIRTEDNYFENILPLTIFNAEVKNIIYELAFESGKYSRFRLDSRFSDKDFKSLYQKWVDNSLSFEFADEVLIFKSSNIIYGFITYKIEKDVAQIGLLGVCKTHQGRGVGSQLVAALEKRLIFKSVNKLLVKTQLQNIEACNFYKKLNFEVKKEIYVSHFWKI